MVGAFEFEEVVFQAFAEGEAGEGAVGADDAVAGDDDAGGIGGVGAADGASGGRRAELGGELAVGARFAEGNREEGGPDALLERSAVKGERKVEGAAAAGEVIEELGARDGGGGGVIHYMTLWET